MLPALLVLLATVGAPAQEAMKPVVVFFRTAACERCDQFERVTLRHPTIERRLSGVAFTVRPTVEEPHVALYDRAVQLAEAGRAADGEVEAATALARLGRIGDARAVLTRRARSAAPRRAAVLRDRRLWRRAGAALDPRPSPSIATGGSSAATNASSMRPVRRSGCG